MIGKIVCKQGNDFRCIETAIKCGETTDMVQSRLITMLSREIVQTCTLCKCIMQPSFTKPDVLMFPDTDYIYFRIFAGIYCKSCTRQALTEAVIALERRHIFRKWSYQLEQHTWVIGMWWQKHFERGKPGILAMCARQIMKAAFAVKALLHYSRQMHTFKMSKKLSRIHWKGWIHLSQRIMHIRILSWTEWIESSYCHIHDYMKHCVERTL